MASNDLRAFIRYTAAGKVIPGSLILRANMPYGTGWVEVNADLCCTTTTTSTTSTTSTTTTVPSDMRLKTNIQRTGALVGLLSEYSWNWNDTAIGLGLNVYANKGVLAQEALILYPEHVVLDENIGYYRVNLEAIGKAD